MTQQRSIRLRNFAAILVVTSPTVSCIPVQQPVQARIEQIVLADLTQGKTLAQIEADVGRALGGAPGADVATIVNDMLALLVDLGAVAAPQLPAVTEMRTVLKNASPPSK